MCMLMDLQTESLYVHTTSLNQVLLTDWKAAQAFTELNTVLSSLNAWAAF